MNRKASGMKVRKTEETGFTLVEVIIAVALLSISLVMIMQLFAGGLRVSRASCDYTKAVVHARDKMEEISLDPIQESGDFEDGFKWESAMEVYKEFEDSDFNLMKLKVKVTWLDTPDKEKFLELVSLKVLKNEDSPL